MPNSSFVSASVRSFPSSSTLRGKKVIDKNAHILLPSVSEGETKMTNLRNIREERGLTQDQVVALLVSRGKSYRSGKQLVSAWERGVARPPISVVPTLAAVLGVSVAQVVEAVEASQVADNDDPDKPP